MYIAPNNKLSNHFRKKRVEKQVWIEDQGVSGSFYQNMMAMMEKTDIQMLYEEYLNPVFSFSNNQNNHNPGHANLPFCNNHYPSSMPVFGNVFGMKPFNHDNDLSDWQEIEQGANYNFEWSGTEMMYKIVLVDPEVGTNVDISISVIYGFVSDFVDTDDDGLSDWQEAALYETNWKDPDCDDDGLLDGEEINTYNTDPNNPDTDGDKLLDGYNVTMNRDDPSTAYHCPQAIYDDWIDMGIYHVGNTFLGELSYGTNATNRDTDGDGMWDGWEAYYGTKPTVSDADEDYDYDNLTNIQEYQNKTHPNNPDTDFDCIDDYSELQMGLNPCNRDYDGDGVADGLDLQPKASWDLNWRQYYIPAGMTIINEFAVLTNKNDELPLDGDIKNEIKSRYSQDIVVDKLTPLSDLPLKIPSEIKTNLSLFSGDVPKYECLYEVTYHYTAPQETDYLYTTFEWWLEPNADQRITLQISLDNDVINESSMWGFIVDIFNSDDDIPDSTYFTPASLMDDDRTYHVNMQIPWDCVTDYVKKVQIGLRPVQLYIKTDTSNGTIEKIIWSPLSTFITVAAITGVIVKNPYFIYTPPGVDPASLFAELPDNLTEYVDTDDEDYSVVYWVNDYQYRITEWISTSRFWLGPATNRLVVDSDYNKVAYVYIGRMLSDVESFENEYVYIVGNCSEKKPPVGNFTKGYKLAYINIMSIKDKNGNITQPDGDPYISLYNAQNESYVLIKNITGGPQYFYEAINTTVECETWSLDILSSLGCSVSVLHTSISIGIERGLTIGGLTVLKPGKYAFVKSTLAEACGVFIAVITYTQVAIAVQEGDLLTASVYAISGTLMISGIAFQGKVLPGTGLKWGGISFWLVVVVIDVYYAYCALTADNPLISEQYWFELYSTTIDAVIIGGLLAAAAPTAGISAIVAGLYSIGMLVSSLLYAAGIIDKPYSIGYIVVEAVYHNILHEPTPVEKIVSAVNSIISVWACNRRASGVLPLIVLQETLDTSEGYDLCGHW